MKSKGTLRGLGGRARPIDSKRRERGDPFGSQLRLASGLRINKNGALEVDPDALGLASAFEVAALKKAIDTLTAKIAALEAQA